MYLIISAIIRAIKQIYTTTLSRKQLLSLSSLTRRIFVFCRVKFWFDNVSPFCCKWLHRRGVQNYHSSLDNYTYVFAGVAQAMGCRKRPPRYNLGSHVDILRGCTVTQIRPWKKNIFCVSTQSIYCSLIYTTL